MYKLLNAGFSRMKKSKVFFAIIIITICLALFLLLNNMSHHIKDKIDGLIFNYINMVGLFMAMFTSLFTGKEYAYGTIRNKIIVGHNRKNIYLSNLIFSIVSGVIFQIMYMLVVFSIGIFTIGSLEMSISTFLLTYFEMLIIIIAYASIFNLITALCTDMTVSTTTCMLLFLAMYILCSVLYSTVNAPKYITSTMTDEYGNIQIIEKELNPNYPSELKMKISKIIYYSIPSGLASQITGDIDNIDNISLFSYLTIIIVVSNGIGIYFFNRKDLK